MGGGAPRELGGACFQGFPLELQLIDRQGYVSPWIARLSHNPPGATPSADVGCVPWAGRFIPRPVSSPFRLAPSTMWGKPGLWPDTGALFLFFSIRFQKL